MPAEPDAEPEGSKSLPQMLFRRRLVAAEAASVRDRRDPQVGFDLDLFWRRGHELIFGGIGKKLRL